MTDGGEGPAGMVRQAFAPSPQDPSARAVRSRMVKFQGQSLKFHVIF